MPFDFEQDRRPERPEFPWDNWTALDWIIFRASVRNELRKLCAQAESGRAESRKSSFTTGPSAPNTGEPRWL